MFMSSSRSRTGKLIGRYLGFATPFNIFVVQEGESVSLITLVSPFRIVYTLGLGGCS